MSCGNTYNVRSFGATGDGSTPDQTAIQDAIDAAAAAGGGVVCFPAGTYRITATLVPKPHVSIHGEARANSIVKVDGPIWGFRSSEAAHVDYECEFADRTVRGNGDPTGSNGSGNNLGGINLERCDYVTFRNVRIDLFSAVNAFGLALGECFWSVLDRCFFYFNQNVDCELYVQTNGCNQTVIRDCKFFGRQMPSCIGLRIRGTQNVLVTGCDFEGDGNGNVGIDLQASNGITLIGNYLELWQGPAIRASVAGLGGCTRVIVAGNVINTSGGSVGSYAVDLNNTTPSAPNRHWILHHNRFAGLSGNAKGIGLGNAVDCITYSNDMEGVQDLLDTVPGQLDNRPFVGYTGTTSWNPNPLGAKSATSITVPVHGARMGDPAFASHTGLPVGALLVLGAYVEAADTVRCVLVNNSSSSIDVGPGTLRAVVLKQLV